MMRERDVVDRLIARVRALGGDVRKARWLGRNGAPDLFVLLPGRHLFVELKRPGAKPTMIQLREHARLRAAGCRVEVVDSIERADEVAL